MRRFLPALLIVALASAALALLSATGVTGRLELLLHDARIATGVGRKPPRDDIVVAWIDQDAMDYMRRAGATFPWPRSIYQEVVAYLREGGARAVAFDVLFTEPGSSSADDTAFGETLAATKGNVLAFKFVGYRDGGFDDAETERMERRGLPLPTAATLTSERGVTLPIPELETNVDGLGFVNVRADADRVHRGYDLLRTWRGRAYPSLALAAALAGGGNVEFADGKLRFGAREVDVDARARMQLNFRGGPLTFEHVQLVNIFESINLIGEGKAPIYPAERFAGKTVLVGINAEGYADVVPAPMSSDFPGVELHATALDNLLSGDALRPLGFEAWLGLTGAVVGTVAVFTLSGAVWPALVLAGLLLAFGALSLAMFGAGVLLPTATPALGTLLAGGGSLLWRLVFEGRKRREMRRAFTSYMAPEVVADVLANPDSIKLGGEVRHVTMVFTDLAGFTGLAEKVAPQELVAFLNDYFTRMCDCVLVERGVIDKFIGDAIMAMFGAPMAQPDHAARAVRAALGMLGEMRRIDAELRAAGRPVVQTRIGVHMGDAVVGNMGSARRFDYTAIGDTVNLASRLEGANKAFGTLCLVSETAWAASAGDVLGREVGLVRVKGRAQPIRVFEPIAAVSTATAAETALVAAWTAALAELRAGRQPEAHRAFAALRQTNEDDPLLALYLERCAGPTWDGVFTLDAK